MRVAWNAARDRNCRPTVSPRGLIEGLQQTPKEIACKYFYDAEGSALFDAICALPEYYQTRTEVALLRRHAAEIAGLIGAEAEIVEFGAGALRKVRILLDALDTPARLYPDRYFRRLSARRGAARWRRTIRAWRCARWWRDFTLPLHIAALAGARAARRFLSRRHHRQFPPRCGAWRCCGGCARRWTAADC